MAESANHLVDEVLPQKPLRQWVLSLPFQLRYLLAAQPKVMGEVLQIFHRALNTYQYKKVGLKQSTGARTGAITFIQRFGGSLNLNLNLNIHFHTLCLDGAYSFDDNKAQFHINQAPSHLELEKLLKQITTRVVRQLERRGLIQKEDENNYYLAPTPWPARGPPATTVANDQYTQLFPKDEF
ncbi:MAG: transposase [Bdellovibrionaceae bacterium]|nr:transposase [Pseudobdellovibrionaceae bacterium]